MNARRLRIDVREDDAGTYFESGFQDAPADRARMVRHLPPQEPDGDGCMQRVQGILAGGFAGKAGWLEDLEHLGKDLFARWIPDSLKGVLQSNSGLNLTWVLCSPKALAIPWELLHDGGEFLGRKHNIGRLLLGGDRATRARPNYAGKLLILANLSGDLPKSQLEGEEVSGFLDRLREQGLARLGILEKPQVTGRISPRVLKEELQRSAMVHFCSHSHGEQGNPEPGWQLSQHQRLGLQEIRDLGLGHSVPAFIFSNSCASGAGSQSAGNDLPGIAGAFLTAGVAGFIGTICRVEDGSSLEFSRRFYGGLAADKSLARVLLEARKNTPREDPIWAAYQFFGDPAASFPDHGAASSPSDPIAKPRNLKKIVWVTAAAVMIAVSGLFLFRGLLFDHSEPKGNFWYQGAP